jgi:hypothetical protein
VTVPQHKEIYFGFGDEIPITLKGLRQDVTDYTDDSVQSLRDDANAAISTAQATATSNANAYTDTQLTSLHQAISVPWQ